MRAQDVCPFLALCLYWCMHVRSPLTLCSPVDWSPPGSSIHGIFQARIWIGLPFPIPGDLPHPGIQLASLESPALAGGFFTTALPMKPLSLSSDSQIGITNLELLFLFVVCLSNQLSAWLLHVYVPLALQTHCAQNRIPLLYLYSVELVQLTELKLCSRLYPGIPE